MSKLIPASITLKHHQTPYSEEFGDHYFSMIDGLAETRHVFIEGAQLIASWQNKEAFTIAETGFGSGLNFLASWLAWENDPYSPQKLHYVSIEKHPLSKEQLREILSGWTELSEYLEQLITHYPALEKGIHTVDVSDQLSLTLCFMDIGEALERLDTQLHLKADTWFLDGFAPAKNPEMWQARHIQKIYKLSNTKATLATFTAASIVRKALIEAGFEVTKREGFGWKREMLTAQKHV